MSEDGHLQSLADENARLRQEVATVTEQMANAEARASSFEDDLAKALGQRDAVIAEAAVLRHRDRWQPAKPGDTPGEMVPGEDDITEGPSALLSSTESADQAQVVPESTHGPETQGEAQGATAVIWHHGCGRTYTADGGPLDCECGDYTLQWSTYFNSTAPPIVDDGTAIKVKWTVPGPRVWNAGDPEPEGVEQVRDRDGDLVTRTAYGYWWWMDPGHEPPLPAAKWEYLLQRYAPLTEVLPEPAPAADNDHGPEPVVEYRDPDGHYPPDSGTMVCNKCGGLIWTGDDGWACSCDGAMFEYAKPDGEVPAAGRAGEAQERTEGLDAAVEAAARALFNGTTGEDPWNGGFLTAVAKRDWRRTAERAVRAASPLIERAALLAAADEIQDAYEGLDYTDSRADGIEFALILLRDLAMGATQVGGGQ